MVEVKYEIASTRIKSSSFHPRRTWLLTGLYTGVIQLWDYRIHSLLETFHGCEGPVRCVSFHLEQPLFVSAGDDYKIRVWNYQNKRCLFMLKGHVDYIRSVFFHNDNPWIVSASDDQTIKIWNWQSRSCLTTIHGHSHYVMCAKFHNTNSIVVSVGLDQTVRLWDITGLVQKSKSPLITNTTTSDYGYGYNKMNKSLAPMDSLMVAVSEGHNRGINWLSLHPKRDYILTASDDRHIILWRYNDMTIYEMETFYGHTNNVCCVEFVPNTDLFISSSEDGTVRLWNFERRCSLYVFSDGAGRYWNCVPHPFEGIGAFSSDTGFRVIQFQNETIAFYTTNEGITYTKGCILRYFDMTASKDKALFNLSGTSGRTSAYVDLSYNPSTHKLIACSSDEYDIEGGRFVELLQFSTDMAKINLVKKFPGKCAVWLNSFSFALASHLEVNIMDKNGILLHTLKEFTDTTQLCGGAFAHDVIICSKEKVTLYNLEEKKIMHSDSIPKVSSVLWSHKKEYAALLGEDTIVFCDNRMHQVSSITEHYSIKSGCWTDMYSDIFIYSTSVHIKYYIVSSNDQGIIRTLDFPLKIALIKANKIFGFDQTGKPRVLMLDDVEIKFKMALVNKNYDHVMKIIKSSDLVGQSLISFLQKKGYSEIALHYIKDKNSQFFLALKCANLEIALDAAKALNEPVIWKKLASFAKSVGEFKIAEFALSSIMAYEELALLYVSCGDFVKLEKLKKQTVCGNINTYLKILILCGDTENLTKVLLAQGHGYLANAMKFEYDLDDNMNTKIELPEIEEKLVISKNSPFNVFDDDAWPMFNREKTIFEYLADNLEALPTFDKDVYEDEEFASANGEVGNWDIDNQVEDEKRVIEEHDLDGAAWALDDDLDIPSDVDDFILNPLKEIAEVELPKEIAASDVINLQASELWKAITFGQFNIVNKLLNGKGVTNPLPMKELLVYYAMLGRFFVSSEMLGSSLIAYVEPQCITFKELNQEFQNALNSTTAGNFEQAMKDFRRCIHTFLLLEPSNKNERDEAKKLLVAAKEYLCGLKIELSRKEALEKKDNKRACELALYFTTIDMQPKHKILALRSAMGLLYKEKNYKFCSGVARKLLVMGIPENLMEQTKKIIAVSEKNDTNAQQLEFDSLVMCTICSCGLKPLKRSDPIRSCTVCGGTASASVETLNCPLCEVGSLR